MGNYVEFHSRSSGLRRLLLADLDALLARYEAALNEHEIPRPY